LAIVLSVLLSFFLLTIVYNGQEKNGQKGRQYNGQEKKGQKDKQYNGQEKREMLSDWSINLI
jgi:hypothetical protein